MGLLAPIMALFTGNVDHNNGPIMASEATRRARQSKNREATDGTRGCPQPDTCAACAQKLRSVYLVNGFAVSLRAPYVYARVFSFGNDLLRFLRCGAQKRAVWKLRTLAHIKRNGPGLTATSPPLSFPPTQP